MAIANEPNIEAMEKAFSEQFEQESFMNDSAGDYFIKEDGYLYFKEKNKKTGELEEVKLANFAPMPLREIVLDDGQEKQRFFEIEALVRGVQPLPLVKIPAREFSSLKWLHDSWGMKAIIEPGNYMKERMRHAIQVFGEDIPEQQVFTHLGWRKVNGEWIYLHSGGSIGGNAEVELEKQELHRYKLPAESINVKETMQTSLDILKLSEAKRMFPLLAMVGLAPLCEAAKKGKGSEPDFVLYVVGRSGSLKSSTVALMMNHFGSFKDTNSLPSSFQDTPAGVEKKGFTTKDSILVVDDYYPAKDKNEKARMDKLAGMLQAYYGDRKGRTRQNSDMSDKVSYPPRGLAVATGEDIPGGSLSRLARFVLVEFEGESVNTELLTDLQRRAGDMANNFVGYINWLAPKMDALPQIINEKYNKYLKAAQKDSQHGRVTSSVAWLTIGLKMFTEYAKEIGAIDKEQQTELLAEGWKAFIANASTQQDEMKGNNPTNMFLDAVREMFGTSTIRTNDISGGEAEGHGDLIGKHDEDYFYLHPKTIYNKVCEFYRIQGTRFPLNEQQLYKHLDHEGHIFTKINNKGQTQRTHLKKIEGKASRYLFLKRTSVEETEE